MLFKFILLALFCSAFGLLDRHQDFNIQVSNINGKNFSSLEEAIEDAEKFISYIKNAYNMPSLVFGISVKGKTIFRKSYGQIDLENSVPANLNSKYRLCSISKTFTSAIIGMLVSQGKLTYDTPINHILQETDFPQKYWDGKPVNITIQHLLSHTGGTHITTLNDLDNVVLYKNTTQMIHKFKNEPLRFKPGTLFEYSNYGFELLGAVIEAVSKKTFEQVLTDYLQNNKLNSTHLDTRTYMTHNRARYYRHIQNYKQNIPTAVFDELFMAEGYYSSGGLLSTVDDLLSHGNLMINAYKGRSGAILPQDIVKKMWTPHTENISPNNLTTLHYGFGWFISKVHNSGVYNVKHRNFVWHAGGLLGTTTMLMVYPEEEIVGVAFTNKGNVLGLDQMILYTAENIYDFVKQ